MEELDARVSPAEVVEVVVCDADGVEGGSGEKHGKGQQRVMVVEECIDSLDDVFCNC